MRSLLLAALLTTAIPVAVFAQEAARPAKLFATAAEVEAALAKAKADHKGDNTNTNEVLVSVGPYPVQLEYRTGTTPPSLHKGQAELIYVMDGGCTLVTGGTLMGQHGTGTTVSGTSIEGGVPRKVSKGDYILVPPDTPHWYTDVRGNFTSVTLHMPMTAGQ
jgi:mannose-6-phosphate isomerase-like protein (cupin superfamily)